MAVKVVEGQLPYTGGTGIGISTDKVISLLLREENNLIKVNNDNEVYTDLQLGTGIKPDSDFPVGVTVGKILASDGRPQNGLILNWKTTSGDYARWIYANDGELYFDNGTDGRKQVYYASEVNNLFSELRDELATVAYTGDYNDLKNRPEFFQVQADWSQTDSTQPDYIKNKPSINDGRLTIQKNGAGLATFTANQSTDTTVNITVPNVINNVTSTSTTDALSANQGKELQEQIDTLTALGRFLSLWDSTTGMPISFPLDIPYNYSTGDYFLVETVGTTNYRPSGIQYTGTASTEVETDEVEIGDIYIYDGTTWLLQINHGKSVSFANLAGEPTDNTALATALDAKANATDVNTKTFYLSSLSDLTTAQAAYDWYVAGKNPIIIYDNKTYLLWYAFSTTGTIWFFTGDYEQTNYVSQSGIQRKGISFSVSNGVVTNVANPSLGNTINSYLTTGIDYPNPYTPEYPGSPATKKYVDDSISAIPSTDLSNYIHYGDNTETTDKSIKVIKGHEVSGGVERDAVTEIGQGEISVSDGNAVPSDLTTVHPGIIYVQDTNNLTTYSQTDIAYNDGEEQYSFVPGQQNQIARMSDLATLDSSTVKVFPLPAQGDDITEIISRLDNGGGAVFYDEYNSYYFGVYAYDSSDEDASFLHVTTIGNGSTLTYNRTFRDGVITGETIYSALVGDMNYSDYSPTAKGGAAIAISTLMTTVSRGGNFTVSAGSTLKPGMRYTLRVTNTATSDITMTFDGQGYLVPASSTVNFRFLALANNSLDFEGPRYVSALPASPDNGKQYFII